MSNHWTESRPRVISVYQHSRVPALKPRACITYSGKEEADLLQASHLSLGSKRGISESVPREGDNEPNPFANIPPCPLLYPGCLSLRCMKLRSSAPGRLSMSERGWGGDLGRQAVPSPPAGNSSEGQAAAPQLHRHSRG